MDAGMTVGGGVEGGPSGIVRTTGVSHGPNRAMTRRTIHELLNDGSLTYVNNEV